MPVSSLPSGARVATGGECRLRVRAAAAFLEEEVFDTRERTGVLILIALYFLFSKRIRLESGEQRISLTAFSVLIGFTVGFYDGFFGPGTGSFFTIAFVLLLGYALPRAIGGTKLLNFTSNVVALGVFILSGHILWVAGIVMGSGQIIGSYLGSHLAVKHGARLIRPMLVTISILMSAKLLLD